MTTEVVFKFHLPRHSEATTTMTQRSPAAFSSWQQKLADPFGNGFTGIQNTRVIGQ